MLGIENIEKITKRIEYIDGQQVFFIDRYMKEEICNAKNYINTNKEASLLKLLRYHLDFIKNQDGFAEIFRPVFFKKKELWIPCLVYYYQGAWRKVAIQNVYCKECGWKGRIACPTDADLFIGSKNWQEIMKTAFELPFLNCPKCEGKLSSNAIWVERE